MARRTETIIPKGSIKSAQQAALTMSKFTPEKRALFIDKMRATHPNLQTKTIEEVNVWFDEYVAEYLNG